MEYLIEKGEKFTTITYKGDKLNNAVAPDLKDDIVRLTGENNVNIILNLEEASYCDSSGLSALIFTNRMCRDNGGRLVICCLQDMVSKLIEISHLNDLLKITPSLVEAQDYMMMEILEDEIKKS
jgi:anti-anti-sigma factor